MATTPVKKNLYEVSIMNKGDTESKDIYVAASSIDEAIKKTREDRPTAEVIGAQNYSQIDIE